MLEAIDLCKIYKPKKGVPVTALNKISLKFPEKGMVFLLGKSGSGKSTLLNLLGGLDKYDSGEIIIKGVSSKNFKQQYFDSYRNTYVGFIFQEYNVLDEFSVGANIALAIELQGRKANDEEINNILKEVDLEGYGDRKPNELSGGQKQRVAIARALVKNPEIIMADEPTGALDSNTGRQVFDTLKKLSRDKLVIIVSHDREFSELYADRIIELADGNVISDVELSENAALVSDEPEKENIVFNDDMVEIAAGYHLTEEDRIAINNYIDTHSTERVSLKLAKKEARSQYFRPTDQSKIKSQDGSTFKLIKSKLPLKSAFKIGASGLKYKKFRLVMTILLSCIAFGLFGLADTFGSYNHVKVCTNSLMDSGVNYLAYAKAVKRGEGMGTWWERGRKIKAEELETMEKDLGMTFTGVFCPTTSYLDISAYYDPDVEMTKTDYDVYATSLSGFTEINNDKLEELNLELAAGKLPDGSKNELAVSDYVYESFKVGGYRPDSETKPVKIETYDDLIGKKIKLDEREYTITGIVNTGLNLERYLPLAEERDYTSTAQRLVDYALYNEFYYAHTYGMASAAMVGEGHVSNLIEHEPKLLASNGSVVFYCSDASDGEIDIWTEYCAELEDIPKDDILWIDGERDTLGEKEIIISPSVMSVYDHNSGIGSSMSSSDEAAAVVKDVRFKMWSWSADSDESIEGNDYRIVGVIKESSIYAKTGVIVVGKEGEVNAIVDRESAGDYDFVVGIMPSSKSEVTDVVSYSYRENSNVRYEIQNGVTYELDAVNDALKIMSKVFLFIGIGFAVFASLMLANFIGTSISHKKQEIGILRAIGSRSNDVFRIFFSESFIIAMINFVLSTLGVFGITTFINSVLRKDIGVLISVLTFGPRQVLLLLVISIAVAAIASFIPVKKIASKKPIDAIRNR